LGRSEVRKLYFRIYEPFGKAATDNENVGITELAFLLMFLIFFYSHPPSLHIQLPVLAEVIISARKLRMVKQSVSLPSLKVFFL
jgi:hypothetical protein